MGKIINAMYLFHILLVISNIILRMRKISNVIVVLLVIISAFVSSVVNAQVVDNSLYKKELEKVELKLREGKFEDGLVLLDQIALDYPNEQDVYYAKALIYSQLGNYDGALENAQKAYSLNSNMFYANYLMELYKSKKRYSDGIALVKDLQTKGNNGEGLNRELLLLYAENGDLNVAKQLYSDLIKSNHSDTLNLVMAEILMSVNERESAKNILIGLQDNSNLPDVYGYLSYIYLQDSKLKDAISVVNRGLSKTGNKTLYMDLAEVYKKQGKSDLMIGALKNAFNADEAHFEDKFRFLTKLIYEEGSSVDSKLMSLADILVLKHPDLLEAQALRGDLFWKLGNIADARSIFLKIVSSNPNHINAWRQVINADLALNQPDEGIKHAMQALKFNPNNSQLLYFASLAYASKKDYEASKNLLETALNFSENENNYVKSMIYGSLGDIYHELKLEDISDVAYQEAIDLDSLNVGAMNNFAYYLANRKKDLHIAAKYSALTNTLEPNTATFMDTYAWVLFQQGNYQEALHWIEKAVKINTTSSVLLEHYGDILSKLGKTNEAVKYWGKSIDLIKNGNTEASIDKIQSKIKEKKYVE